MEMIPILMEKENLRNSVQDFFESKRDTSNLYLFGTAEIHKNLKIVNHQLESYAKM